ncbi:PLP-dependent aminotransferase family protein [Symbiopectobacterium purcellii]|uniref:PLP-dependent aminotransferase family protein n=1 Tax=Symbiopectobacterium purcellii TaxID=2871826 RepID=A0ABX9ATM5_9ENTR|nr:PLP-dependent aminotransferase family protein [Symbiopectobacterium purcellii]QZN97140.1 PLP-dependent aminotransferase family protein [Symbiopectobacterium purcellii]
MKARYKAIVDEFATAIRSGTLLPGTRLSTHRALSVEKHISLATATRVYAELEAMGLVSGESGRGTFVREISLPAGLGLDQHVVASDVLDLNFNYPSLPDQAERLRDAMRQLTTSGDLASLLRYQPHAGRQSDRDTIASWLNAAGIQPSADEVLVVNGAQHGLTVAVMGLLKPGDVVAVDALIYPGFIALARLCHLELVAIPAHANGPDLDAFRQICQRRRIRAVYTMPTLHNPLGWVLNDEQRKKLTLIARTFDLLIIEDAAYAFLVRRPPPPLAAYAPERTVYVTGFAKSIATGLRVGAVFCPANMRGALERAIRATTWNTPSLMVSIVCGWIKDGTIQRFESLKRRDARQRQALARKILSDCEWVGHSSSYFLWLPLPQEIRADQLVHRLMQQHISVSTAEPFCSTNNVPHALRLALGSVSMNQLSEALTAIKDAIEYERDL